MSRRRINGAALCGLLVLFAGPGAAQQVAGEKEDAARTEIEVRFEGNREVRDSRLRKLIERDLEDFRAEPRASYLDDAAFEIAAHYRELGYASVEVEFEQIRAGGEVRRQGAPPPPEAGEPPRRRPRRRRALPQAVVFHITEGPRAVVEEIRFKGTDAYSRKELLSFFPSARGGVLGLDEGAFSRQTLEDEAAELESFYRGNGYLDATVELSQVAMSEDGRRATVTVEVMEGPRYMLESVEIAGAELIPESIRRDLVQGFVDGPYHPRFPFEIRGRLQDSFAKRGYAEAQVEVDREIDSETGQVRLQLSADPGPQIVIDEIEVRGNQRTREDFIRSQLAFEPGQTYSIELERESFRQLYRTGLFKRVRLSVGEGEGPERPLVVEVDEYATRELFVEPGYGSYEQLRLRLGFTERNLFGSGSQLRANATVAQRALRAQATYSDPWQILEAVTTDVSVDANQRELEGFTSAKYGAGVALRKDWSDKLTSSVGYQFRRSESQDADTGSASEVSRDDVDISSLRFSSRFDTRDNFFVPRQGWLAEASLEYATRPLGSEIDFFRFRVTTSFYQPLSDRLVLAAGLRVGAIYPIREQDSIPLQERFFSGGENSVRAFKENELLPVGDDGMPVVDDEGNSEGGEAFSTLTVELRQQIWGNLQGAVFLDSGILVPEADQLLDPFEVRYGYGLGLRYLLPIGPVRLDGAWKADRRPGEETFVLHFSVGMAI